VWALSLVFHKHDGVLLRPLIGKQTVQRPHGDTDESITSKRILSICDNAIEDYTDE